MVRGKNRTRAFPGGACGAGLVLLVAGLFIACVGDASAVPIGSLDLSGIGLVATGGEVTAFFVGSSAGFNSTISLDSPCCSIEFFPNHATSVGTSFSLGTFAAGTPLVLEQHVATTGDDWFTGPASNNDDDVVHAGIGSWGADASIPVNGILVGFEDLAGGGDLDYNDLRLVLVGARPYQVPETPSALLFGVGLLVLAAAIGIRIFGPAPGIASSL
jgi:hypothetical protein